MKTAFSLSFNLQFANPSSNLCLDSFGKADHYHTVKAGLYSCHNQGGNQVGNLNKN